MIFIEHEHGTITNSLYYGENATEAIIKIAQDHPNQSLMVYHKGIDVSQFVTAVKDLIKPYIIFSSYTTLHNDLGYIEDSPFIRGSKTVIYPTWIKSTIAFTIDTSLINLVHSHLDEKVDLLYWLNSISKLARPLGILSYQVPLYLEQNESFNMASLYRFVKQHYKFRWTFLLFLCHVWYEKRFPLYAFAKALFYKQINLPVDVLPLQEVGKPFNIDNSYDVIIPTMGRKNYLFNVLNDLSKQTLLPKKVVLFEQNDNIDSQSQLDYIKQKWPFQIEHVFTHITGACNARNKAIDLTDAPWVLLFDDDNEFHATLLADIFDALSKLNTKVLNMAYLQKGETETMQAFKQWESFGSGCSIVHKDVLEQCSFDMALEHGYGEDVDFGMQIRNAGYDVIYAPQIQILHLKAPVGGFRKPHVFPWNKEDVQPKPSPQIMYYRKKNYTHKQLLGYKMVQFFKTYGAFGTKIPWKHYAKYKQAWNLSEKWAKQL